MLSSIHHPDLMDGLNFTASYTPSTANGNVQVVKLVIGVNYSGFEGLSFIICY